VADRLFEGEDAVLDVTGWVGRPHRRGRFVDARLFSSKPSTTDPVAWLASWSAARRQSAV